MEYPDWLQYFPNLSFMTLPIHYQEFFVRWYYYDNTDRVDIPDTVPVEHIEDYIVNHLNEPLLWEAKGFVAARDIGSSKNNILFRSDVRFAMIVHYVAKLWYTVAVENKWIKSNITKKEFEKECLVLGNIGLA